MRRTPPSLPLMASIAALAAVVLVACSGGLAPSPSAAGPSAGTAAPTVPPLDQLSLTPALVTAEPDVAGPPLETPPAGPPEGIPPPPEGAPPPPPEVTVEYTGPADDLAGFVAAYRQTFAITELSDEVIATAGARLCTYLQRQATPNGSVDLGRAMTEADINEPGYPREVWQLAFELATAHYCGEFSFAPGTEG